MSTISIILCWAFILGEAFVAGGATYTLIVEDYLS